MRRAFPTTHLLLALWALVSPAARADILLQERVSALPFSHQGPFVRSADRAIWAVDARGALVSRDEGRSWTRRAIFDEARFESSGERALLRTREGVILYAFLNRKELDFRWDDARGPLEGCRLPVYLSRSADDGVTWAAPVQLQDGWCGAVRQLIQLRSGRIVLVCQQAKADPGRHVTTILFSDDLGQTWQSGETIDLGEAGNYRANVAGLRASTHGGAIEGTVTERADGTLFMLLRVPHGCFYWTSSRDGSKWGAPIPSPLEASDSPGMLTRLASGRLALVFNRYRDPVKRAGRRDQLSLTFSENDGLTWTPPQVIAASVPTKGARESAGWLSYPYVFEPEPGRLWLSTMQGALSATLSEEDFLRPVERPLDGGGPRLIALGDSITRGARKGVEPGEAYVSRLQAALRETGRVAWVHNAGIGGERTDQALARLDSEIIAQRPDLVTVMYGTNDSWVDAGKTASRLSERAYAENLREIVRRLRAGGARVVLMTPPMFAEENPRNGLGEDPNVRLAPFAAACRAVAAETGVALVDHFAGWAAAQSRGERLQPLTTDGCHPNAAGHSDLTARLLPAILPLVRDLSP